MSFLKKMLFCCILSFDTTAWSQLPNFHLLGSPETVFKAGEDGYACYRIPAVVQLLNQDLIAFAEGRKGGCSDTGDIDLVMKRSIDGGKTWGSIQVIWDNGETTCGNPAPIVDQKTGIIHLLSTWNLGSDHEREIIDQTSEDTRRIFLMSSMDHGNLWSAAKEITSQVKKENWTWYATGPGSGIQLQQGPNKGRLVVACDHIEAETKKYYAHVIISDDHGEHWQIGGSSPKDQVNESEVIQLVDGRLMLNMRNYDRTIKNRQVALSNDGGISWSDQRHDPILIEPICQASLHAHKNLIFFSNPAATDERINMTLRVSADLARSWPKSISLHLGPSAYSDLVSINDFEIGCLFESGSKSPYEEIVFQRVAIRD